MENSKIIEIIRLVLEGYKHSDDSKEGNHHYLKETIGGKDYYLWNCDYLLNQIIRHYNVPDDHWYYSEEAKKLWEDLGMPISEFKNQYDTYWIKPKKQDVQYKHFKGTSNVGKDQTGDFRFNNVFHIEHIIPIAVIIKELTELNDLSDQSIMNVLDKICCARILKTENVEMHNKYKRGNTFNKVYHELYLGCNIKLYSNASDKLVE